jgi:hypothetical protein
LLVPVLLLPPLLLPPPRGLLRALFLLPPRGGFGFGVGFGAGGTCVGGTCVGGVILRLSLLSPLPPLAPSLAPQQLLPVPLPQPQTLPLPLPLPPATSPPLVLLLTTVLVLLPLAAILLPLGILALPTGIGEPLRWLVAVGMVTVAWLGEPLPLLLVGPRGLRAPTCFDFLGITTESLRGRHTLGVGSSHSPQLTAALLFWRRE